MIAVLKEIGVLKLNTAACLSLFLGTVVCCPIQAAPSVRRDATVTAVEKVLPSVVNVSSKTVQRRQGFLFDWWRDNWSPFLQQLPPQYSAGSGVIIDEEGYVLSNVHVVEGATEIVITLQDNRTYPADLVIGTRKSDVALLKLRSKPGEKFTPIAFAADDDLYIGETVVALGNPFGLGGSVSRGILSSKTRRSNATDGYLDMEDWLQTDAAINPGNSGGPLVNLDGELIGLNVAVFREGQGIGFAIPVKRISESLAEIFTPENVRSLWFGATFKSTTNGIVVASLEDNSPAHEGGLRTNDIIGRINSALPKSVFTLNREIMAAGSEKPIQFQVRRGSKIHSATVRLKPEADHFNSDLILRKIGLSLRPITAQDSRRLGVAFGGGFIVTEIEQGSPADHAGFQQGLILEALDGIVPDSVTTAAKMLARKKAGETARLTLLVPRPFRRAVVDLKVR